MLHRTGLWRLTRNRYGRRLWDLLAGVGVKATRMYLDAAAVSGDEHPAGQPSPPVSIRAFDEVPDDPLTSLDPAVLEPGDVVIAAVDDGTVGYCVLSHGRPVHVGPLDQTVTLDGGYIWRLYVAPSHRDRGVATALVGAAVRHAGRRFGADRCYALVAADNVPSQRVFEGNGFARVATVSYLAVPGFSRRRWRDAEGRPHDSPPVG